MMTAGCTPVTDVASGKPNFRLSSASTKSRACERACRHSSWLGCANEGAGSSHGRGSNPAMTMGRYGTAKGARVSAWLRQHQQHRRTGVVAVVSSRLRLIHQDLAVGEHDSAVFGSVRPPRVHILRTHPARRSCAHWRSIVVAARAYKETAAVAHVRALTFHSNRMRACPTHARTCRLGQSCLNRLRKGQNV